MRFQNQETNRLVNEDIKNISFVFIACLLYIVFHTKSLFLASVSLFNVLMSVPISLFIYNRVFQVQYFSSLHISVVIVIIGIGSDDIFVFHDQWQNSLKIKALRDRPIMRLSYAWRNAAVQMLVTSFTSSVAFFACTSSPIMPIRSFGVFSFIIVLNCFLITILVQPVNYFIYEKFISNIGWKDKRLAHTSQSKDTYNNS